MKGAIFFSGKYGSTEQYANWIGEATGLPVLDIKDPNADPSDYDYLLLGSSILYFKLSNRKWVNENYTKLDGKVRILFSVSGAGPGDKLNSWVADSLPPEFVSQFKHVGLKGKLDHSQVSWWIKTILWVGSLFNKDKNASKDERYGFDYMDRESIKPIVEMVKEIEEASKIQTHG